MKIDKAMEEQSQLPAVAPFTLLQMLRVWKSELTEFTRLFIYTTFYLDVGFCV